MKSAAPVNPKKQSTAFPPNFVHSLDASHMMLSAIACQAKNIEFAAVHDSYWTHACNVEEMGEILREAFVRLHSEEILERLRNELLERYANNKISVNVKLSGADTMKVWNEHRKSQGKKAVKSCLVRAWVGLKFDPIPERGKFDIARVRNSQYFFH